MTDLNSYESELKADPDLAGPASREIERVVKSEVKALVNDVVAEQGELYEMKGHRMSFNAAAIAALYIRENDVCWVVEYASYFFWDGAVWKPRTEDEIINGIRLWWVQRSKTFAEVLGLTDGMPLLADSMEQTVARRIRGMVSKRDVVTSGMTVNGVDIMPLADGDLWLEEDARFEKPSPRVFVRGRLGVAWNRLQSQSSDLEIEQELFFPALGGDSEMVEALWDLVARCVLPRGYFPAINYLGGEPGAGKTTILNFILALAGEAACKELDFGELAGSAFAKGFFAEGRVLYADDIGSDALSGKGAHKLKSLTGGGVMQGRLPFAREKVNFRGDFQILLSSNKDQRIALDDDFGAWERRFCVWKFKAYERKKTIEHYHSYLLEKEGYWIIQRILKAVKRLRERQEMRLPIWRPSAMMRQVDAMLNASDTIVEFLSEYLVADSGYVVTKSALRDGYNGYARAHGLSVMSRNEFSSKADAAMERVFGLKLRKDVPDDTGKHQRGWHGLKWIKTP
ncbi:hypothetical protein JIN77_11395 [Verrucomicrobiaceae bacterium R5-34]|nr:hypothetical protein [Verrucomicrobiaceae bacterium R5-34]